MAKAFLSSERTCSRKIKEAIFARRLEARYSKREILALYLNHIFLGDGAYGVQAAARHYFDKDVAELDLGQLALIAGLAQAPSRYSPFVDEEAALKRRAEVLDNMVENGALARADAEQLEGGAARASQPRRDYFHEVTPYFSEQVRRDLVKKLGQKALYEGGYRVETTVLPYVDVLAQENVDTRRASSTSARAGAAPRRGSTRRRRAEFPRARARALRHGAARRGQALPRPRREGERRRARRCASARRSISLPLENMPWAAPFSASDATNDKTITAATEALKRHDVVWVRWACRSRVPRFSDFTYDEQGEATWLPEQLEPKKPPKTQSSSRSSRRRACRRSLYTYDHRDGYVLAMAGGDDFDRSEFNRVTQACRQPGSAYKPIYYSLALDRGYAFDTLWNDKPKAEIDPDDGRAVDPAERRRQLQRVGRRSSARWCGRRIRRRSRSSSILGTKDVEKWAHRLGITTPLVTNRQVREGVLLVAGARRLVRAHRRDDRAPSPCSRATASRTSR